MGNKKPHQSQSPTPPLNNNPLSILHLCGVCFCAFPGSMDKQIDRQGM